MQGQPEVIELLNDILRFELTAINQYYLNARMCHNWGYKRLAKRHYDISFDEMRDTHELIDRILYLEGHPNLQRLNPIAVGETPVEQIRLALELEHTAVRNLNSAINRCLELNDHGTREFLAEMIKEEEEHADYWESQIEAINQLGEPLYLAQQLHE